ncbi:hypothetical protein BpHYR1_050980 [Brachionus plicatilis]|uniref:Uncharacterized protein n=1 Tax=Brachionus plicatilis TaxID=10195 RepID=A0A3M7QYA1_BRAPC|nr:hypothetical protein BpHYR1_050980 [Brachionus plicatilis]
MKFWDQVYIFISYRNLNYNQQQTKKNENTKINKLTMTMTQNAWKKKEFNYKFSREANFLKLKIPSKK